ncbi:LarC family nickel insertion protein, partial [Candidatus Aminicenantes bacterium AC-334-E05]|nr:LarC family nickel insertion protein [Candidatus Aminicenantes bacterium AC-334-E05]
AHVKGELVTPTGASIIATLCSKFSDFPEIEYEKIGYGAGSKDFPDFPNILRAFYGEINKEKIGEKERIYVIETNIDDINPQFLGAFFTKALSLGALDVFLTPVVMKKNRLGNKLTILTKPDKINSLLESLFKETTSIGVRYFPVERIVLKREIKKVKVFNQEVGIKISYLKEDEINIQPEFSDCEKVAEMTGKSIKEIYQIAITEYLKSKK